MGGGGATVPLLGTQQGDGGIGAGGCAEGLAGHQLSFLDDLPPHFHHLSPQRNYYKVDQKNSNIQQLTYYHVDLQTPFINKTSESSALTCALSLPGVFDRTESLFL